MVSVADSCWRVRRSSRITLACLLVAVFLAFLVGGIIEGFTVAAGAALLALAVVLAAAWWICVGRPRVVISGHEVVVVNPTWTHRRRLRSIVGVSAGWWGVWIESNDERPVAAWAVQKANLSTWTGRRTRADDLVDAITAAKDEVG